MSNRAIDLHPDDLAARVAIRDQIRQLRIDAGIGLREAGRRTGVTGRAVWELENNRTNSRISTYQAAARICGARLHVALAGLPDPDDGDPYTHGLRQIAPADDAHADRLALQLLVADVRRHREWQGLTTFDLAARCRVVYSAITRLEHSAPAAVMVATVQRTARGLGGHLEMRLDVPAAVVA